MKKILLGLSTLGALAGTTAVVASCNHGTKAKPATPVVAVPPTAGKDTTPVKELVAPARSLGTAHTDVVQKDPHKVVNTISHKDKTRSTRGHSKLLKNRTADAWVIEE